jgi:hypothetical protein
LRLADNASFCELAPGRYPYRVIRSDPSTGASQRLEGVVIVRPAVPAMAREDVASHSAR